MAKNILITPLAGTIAMTGNSVSQSTSTSKFTIDANGNLTFIPPTTSGVNYIAALGLASTIITGTSNQITATHSGATGQISFTLPLTVIFPGIAQVSTAPVGANDLTNKNYVDSLIPTKAIVRAFAPTNVNISNPGTTMFDGVNLVSTDRLMLGNQSDPTQNGIFVFNGSSSALTRASDFNTWAQIPQTIIRVQAGSTYNNTLWLTAVQPGGTIGAAAIVFKRIDPTVIAPSPAGVVFSNGSILSTGLITDSNVNDVAWGKITGVPGSISAIASLQVDTGLSISSSHLVLGQAIGDATNPAKLLSSREIPLNGSNLVFTGTGNIGIKTTAPIFPLDINGTLGVTSASGGYTQTFTNGTWPATLYVAHGSNNWGLNISRASADNLSPNQSFYKSRSASLSSKTSIAIADQLGRTSFHGVAADNATIAIGAETYTIVESVTSGSIRAGFRWSTNDGTGVQSTVERMYLNSTGELKLSSYPNTRFDGSTDSALYVDITGNVKYGKVNAKAQSLVGSRYNKSTWIDLSDFSLNGGISVSIVSNMLSFVGGASNYSQWLNIPDGTCLERWSYTATLTVSSIGAGLAIGSRSYYTSGTPRWLLAIFNTTTGTLSIGVDGTPNPVIAITSSDSILFTLSTDVLEITISQDGYNARASIRNVTTNSAAIVVTYTYTTDPSTVTRSMPNTSYMSVVNLGGNFKINSLQWSVLEPMNSEIMLVGDSLLKGHYCSGSGRRFGDLLNNFFTPTIIAAGDLDTTDSILHRVGEIITLHPKKVLVLIGAVDVQLGVSNATIIANYDSFISQLITAGIDVYHLVAIYQSALDQSPLTNHIVSTYLDAKIINLFALTSQAGLVTSDNSHLNDHGQKVILDFVLRSNKLSGGSFSEQNPIRNQSLYVQSASFSIDGKGTLNGADTLFQVLNQVVSSAASTSLINLSTTWNTSGTPSAIFLNVTDTASSVSSNIINLQVNSSTVFNVTKSGQLNTMPTVNQVQQIIKLPSSQTVVNPIFQIQKSDGTPWFNINTNGPWNIFVGIGSGINNTVPTSISSTGSSNTGVGYNTFNANTTGNMGSAFGASALIANTTGSINSAFGQAALLSNTTGGSLTAFGQASLRNNTTGSHNIGIGVAALCNNSTGSFSIAIGDNALAQASQSTISNSAQNIAIGYNIGFTSTIGINNILVGYNSHVASSLIDNNILIGASQTGTSLTNTTLIGSSLNSTVSNIVGLGRADQNIIIGLTSITTDTGARIQVTGTTQTGSAQNSTMELAQTWNTTGNPTLIKINLVNTASGSSSKFLDLQLSGTSLLNITKTGIINSIDSITSNSNSFGFDSGGSGVFVLQGNGAFLIKQSLRIATGAVSAPTAQLHLGAGTATIGTAPMKFTTGTALLSTPEDGAWEFFGSHVYFTIGSTRYQIDQQTGGGGGGGTVTSVSGTPNRITSSGGNDPSIDIDAAYVGQASITTLGTITTGTWSATAVAIAHGGTGQVTATAALNALLPSQTSNAGKIFTTDGTNSGWKAQNILVVLTDSSTTNWDYTTGNVAQWTINGNRILNVTGTVGSVPAFGVIEMIQGTGGNFIPTLPGNQDDVIWRLNDGDVNIIRFYWNGTAFRWASNYSVTISYP